MTAIAKAHARICDMCDHNAERPFTVIWDISISERISFCSKKFFEHFTISKSYDFVDLNEIIFKKTEVKKKEEKE